MLDVSTLIYISFLQVQLNKIASLSLSLSLSLMSKYYFTLHHFTSDAVTYSGIGCVYIFTVGFPFDFFFSLSFSFCLPLLSHLPSSYTDTAVANKTSLKENRKQDEHSLVKWTKCVSHTLTHTLFSFNSTHHSTSRLKVL